MTPSSAKPRPVPVRRYRYSKWRWRVLVHALDFVGAMLAWLWRSCRPAMPHGSPRRILVIQLDHLGDAVLSSPLLPRLRAACPGATIDVLASASNHAVFRADPHVDRVLVASRNWFERRPGSFSIASALWKLGRELRQERYDLAIDVRGDVLSVLLMALARIPRRAGWDMGGGGFLLTDVAEWRPGRHEVASRMALLDGFLEPDVSPSRVVVYPTDRHQAKVASLLAHAWPRPAHRRVFKKVAARVGGRGRGSRPAIEAIPTKDADTLHAGRFGESAPLLAIHLGAGTAAKRWPTAHWRDLVARFLEDGWRIVLVGGPDDRETAGRIAAHPELRDFTGMLSLMETAALLERADLFVGADSGPAHLAACAGTPSVILFSGTNQAGQWRPWSRRSLVIRNRRVACRPCHNKTCPLADHPCMTGIRPERVHRVARRWWSRLHQRHSPHSPI